MNIITIDGPCGGGKTSTAKLLAGRLGYIYLDTGGVFRTIALYILEHGFEPEICALETSYDEYMEKSILARCDVRIEMQSDGVMHTFLGGFDRTKDIRSQDISDMASRIAVFPQTRELALSIERAAAEGQDIVAEGRDTGSIVFPGADLKIYLSADIDARAARRYAMTPDEFESIDDARIKMQERDKRDSERELAPLTRPADAIDVDNTDMDLDETVSYIEKLARKHLKIRHKWVHGKFQGKSGYMLDLGDSTILFIYRSTPNNDGYTGMLLIGQTRVETNRFFVRDISPSNHAKNLQNAQTKIIKNAIESLNTRVSKYTAALNSITEYVIDGTLRHLKESEAADG